MEPLTPQTLYPLLQLVDKYVGPFATKRPPNFVPMVEGGETTNDGYYRDEGSAVHDLLSALDERAKVTNMSNEDYEREANKIYQNPILLNDAVRRHNQAMGTPGSGERNFQLANLARGLSSLAGGQEANSLTQIQKALHLLVSPAYKRNSNIGPLPYGYQQPEEKRLRELELTL